MGNYETREVLAAAYTSSNSTHLSHSVELRDGKVYRVLCKRVSEFSLADPFASDVSAKPTCRQCAANDPRFKAPEPFDPPPSGPVKGFA